MPYTVRDLVLSKYILGWCFTAAAALIVLAAGEVERQFVSGISASPAATGLALCVGTLATALTLPLMFRFSVERGRMFFLLLVIVLACGSAGLFSGIAEDPAAAVLTRRLVLILPAATILCSVLSVFLSIRLYQKRMQDPSFPLSPGVCELRQPLPVPARPSARLRQAEAEPGWWGASAPS